MVLCQYIFTLFRYISAAEIKRKSLTDAGPVTSLSYLLRPSGFGRYVISMRLFALYESSYSLL